MSPNPPRIPHYAGPVIATTLLNSVTRQFPLAQVKRGNHELDQARYLAREYESVISEQDRRVIGDSILQ
jgi:hypothetical protein